MVIALAETISAGSGNLPPEKSQSAWLNFLLPRAAFLCLVSSAPLRLCGKPKTGAWYSASLLRESASVSLPLRRKQSFFRKESEYVATPVAVFAQVQGRFPPQFELFMFVKKKRVLFLLDTGRGRPVASLPSLPETALWQLLSTSVFPFRDARRTVHKQRRTQGVNPLSHSPRSSHSPVEPPDDEIFQTFL